MNREPVTQLFNELKGQFDTEEPRMNHHNRFVQRLSQSNQPVQKRSISWRKPLAIAASIVLIVMVALSQKGIQQTKDLADVSPEMQKSQEFFTATINKELFQIQEKATPETQKLIDDAIQRMEHLEEAYTSLKNDLTQSGEDKRVIHAMIDNFQNRVAILQQVLEQIDAINSLHTLQPATSL